jgi:acetyl-CoA C-acetyltransferase
MPDAVIVSTARTPIGRAYRGAFNTTHGAVLGGHVVQHAVARAGVDPGEVDDVVMGCAMPERATGQNIARLSAIRAGLPVSVGGMTINRFCSSGLQTIAVAAQRIIAGEADVIVAGGLESISLVLDGREAVREDWLMTHKPEVWMPMLEPAAILAARYGLTPAAHAAYSPTSQRRTAAAQQAGRFADEIVPLPASRKLVDKVTRPGELGRSRSRRRGQPPRHDADGLAALKPVREGGSSPQAMQASCRTAPPACPS